MVRHELPKIFFCYNCKQEKEFNKETTEGSLFCFKQSENDCYMFCQDCGGARINAVQVEFKDKSIYKKSKHTLIVSLLFKDKEKAIVEIEKLSTDSCWICHLPTEQELETMQKNGIDISFYDKYRRWQKRNEYTIEEFNKIYEI